MSGMLSQTQPDVIVRPATVADIPSIQRVARESWADTYRGVVPESAQVAVLNAAYSRESLEVSIAHNQAFLVARVGEGIAGYIDLGSDGHEMTLNRLYVLPEYQRLGLGRALYEEAVNRMLALTGSPVVTVVTEVMRDNPKARAFYRKLGFIEDEEEIMVIGGVSLPVIRISMTVRGGAGVREDSPGSG